jgi:mannose-6-phosphate isomerase
VCGIIAELSQSVIKISIVVNPNLSAPASLHAEILYGSSQFQVRLLRLNTGILQSSYPQEQTSKALLFVIDGPLRVINANENKTTITKGQRLESVAADKLQLANETDKPISMVEVRWGDSFAALPLREVTETRPWGSFTVLKDEPDYKLKQLEVNPGNRLSLQRHQKREEHWLVTAGNPEVTLDDDLYKLNAGEYIWIPKHSWHRISNPASNEAIVEIIELQLGDYFGEDDIERQQDDYGRS